MPAPVRSSACRDNGLVMWASCNENLLGFPKCLLAVPVVRRIKVRMRTAHSSASLLALAPACLVIPNSSQKHAQQCYFLTGHFSQAVGLELINGA